jgi:prophage antirepressor-like protein
MSIIIDIFSNILQINNIQIYMIVDDKGIFWFHANRIAKSLGYKKSYDTINNLISLNNIKKYKHIKIIKSPIIIGDQKDIQKLTKFINETGIYEFLLNSRIDIAKKLKKELVLNILPALRKTGEYILSKTDKDKLEKINNKLKKLETDNQTLVNNQQHIVYPTGTYLYIIKVKYNDKKYYKIGYTKNLNKRLSTYNTSFPNKINFNYIIKIKNETIDKCIKKVMKNKEWIKNKEYYKTSLTQIINFIKNCSSNITSIICGICLKKFNLDIIKTHKH